MDNLIREIERYSKKCFKHLNRPGHVFRDRYSHTLRVLEWAKRIQLLEGGDLDVITCAVLLHDIGWEEGRNHADVSYEMAVDFLENYELDDVKRTKVLEAVKNHNRRAHYKEFCLETRIVMDADMLDEVGALSIVWDVMAEREEECPTYESALKRIEKYSSKLNDGFSVLVTETGKKFYGERLKVREDFLNQLKFEIEIWQ